MAGTFYCTVASDGVLTVTLKDQSDTVLGTGQGVLSADGCMVLLSDTDGADSDGEITLAIGIKR